MSNTRTFYETTFTVSVLSEEPIPEGMDLPDVLAEAFDGAYVATVESEPRELTEAEVRVRLTEMGSDPGFFGLEEEGDTS